MFQVLAFIFQVLVFIFQVLAFISQVYMAAPGGAGIHLPSTYIHLPRGSIHLPGVCIHLPGAGIHLPGVGIHLPAAGIHLPGAGILPLSRPGRAMSDPGDSGGDESAAVLSRAFGNCVNHVLYSSVAEQGVLSHSEILSRIKMTSNLSVLKVTRVQNMSRSMLYDAFGATYNIEGTAITAYHGTDHATALTIASRGFRGSCSKRSVWGKGIYVSTNIWEAIAYAKPSADCSQTFLVVDIMTGPIIIGSQDLADFGQDAEGNQVLTTTDLGNTILCASYSDQMLATYVVTVRFNVENPNNSLQEQTVRTYHGVIWSQYQQAKAKITAAAAVAAPRPTAPPAVPVAHASWKGIALGDKVRILKSFSLFKFCDGKEGTVRAIVMDNKINYCVQVDGDVDIGLEIQACNVSHFGASTFPGVLDTWVRCRLSQVEKI